MAPKNLAKCLENQLRGEVRFDDGSRAIYATDASNYRQIPIGVVFPKDIDDLLRAIAVCREFDVPLLNRGAGTSLAGQCCNVAVVIDTSKYVNRILEIDAAKRTARVEPGLVLDVLQDALKPHDLVFGPDPATHSRCTIGGMIGNNACGVHSVMAGKTCENIEALEILTYDGARMSVGCAEENSLEKIIREGGKKGEIYFRLKALRDKYADLIRSRYPGIPRRVSGYNLDELLPEKGFNAARALAGSEGTCVTVLSATLKLAHNPPFRSLLVLAYPDIYGAADDVPRILAHKPIGLEGLDENYIRRMKKRSLNLPEIAMLPDGNGWLLAEFGGESKEEAEIRARKALKEIAKGLPAAAARLFLAPREQKMIWAVREATFGSSVFVPGERDTYAGFEDSAVLPEKLGNYLRELQPLYDKYGYDSITYGHFGDGCVHTRLSFDLRTETGIRKYRSFMEEAAELVTKHGGSLSGEHGDGQNWGEFLHKMYGPEMVQAFREFKTIWDPRNRMNPGKLVDAYRADENLRLKTYKTVREPRLHFRFTEENGVFARTTERCIGIAKCLKKGEGTMCPSYMATHEEKYSTRGRAHLLHEMMRGEILKGGWRNEQVKDALESCLACKGCKTECPVSVDMATYKAEFLSHYYRGRLRPPSAYVFGLLHLWCRIASWMPRTANFFTQTPGLSRAVKWLAGIAPERRVPAFAQENFKNWFRKRPVKNALGPRVLLWPDTWNDHFAPEVLRSACEVLEAAGFRVLVPRKTLTSGRPLYDSGMLNMAKHILKKIIRALKPEIERDIPVVVLEPSDASVFRDEMLGLLPDDRNAQKFAAQVFLFGEFLRKKAPGFQLPPLPKKAVVQGHCHQKSLAGTESDIEILKKLCLDFEMLDSGCCGMAGAFGFKKENYEMSMKIAEERLFPALRKAGPEALIIADGFSCREQIASTGRRAFHLAQVIAGALKTRE